MHGLPLILCFLAAIGLIAVGALALLSPRRLSRSYGAEVRDRPGFAFVGETGARDCVFGAIFLAALTRPDRDPGMLLALCAAGFVLSLADFSIAFSFAGRFRSEHLAHVGGALAFAVIAALLSTGA
jgi:membrane associated rhomboid family serine protease